MVQTTVEDGGEAQKQSMLMLFPLVEGRGRRITWSFLQILLYFTRLWFNILLSSTCIVCFLYRLVLFYFRMQFVSLENLDSSLICARLCY
ncbi:hypothetical protein BT96DRAFT_711834 [Gymnopus androsaceus JB14]|uniref:Uncharacterized protein n=1 Tax=Gymnopus androsaceus JB14 TaxID=1447944 RepID=A0A6A4HKE5_9AGAR|nr:hypothetical protein BT96DRAFT_711834 [Gymnopus androsaceus JB14]